MLKSISRTESVVWAFVLAVFAGALLALGCGDSPTGVGTRFVRPYFDVEGDGPLCEKGEEWNRNGHVDSNSEF